MKLTTYIPYLLHRADSQTVGAFEHILKKHGMSLFEWRVLASLAHFQEMRFGELASSTAIEPPTLARILTDMEGKRLVARNVSPVDKRVRLVRATEKGESLAKEISPEAEQHENKLLAGFTEDEGYMLRRMLERIYQNMHEAE
jgi:MarR family transcriptional regulator for hemolysin